MKHLGKGSGRTFALLASLAFALDLLALSGADIGIGPRSLADRVESYILLSVPCYFVSLVVVIIAFYLFEIVRDLIRWIGKR
jgi:hypothetical protein